MPSIPPRTSIVILGGVVAVLLLGAYAARGASSTLLSPLPAVGVVPALLASLVVVAGVVVLLGGVPLPRLVRRLVAIGLFATTFWSIGTIARGTYVTLAFAFGEAVEEEESPWQVLGQSTDKGATQTLAASSLELGRSIFLPFDSAAVAVIAERFMCFTLPVERTASGVTRVRLPERALGLDELEPCPAVRSLGR